MKTIGTDLFGADIEKDELLRDKFIEPPFSILDARGGDWQNRKRKWKALGIKSEETREGVVLMSTHAFAAEKYGRSERTDKMSEVSIFDPALCELMYHWFCPPGGKILDPFAGGSVRGIIAGYLGFQYVGCELRDNQVEANYGQATEFGNRMRGKIGWVTGDSDDTLQTFAKDSFDFIFSCPPYHDLEVYSDDPADLSNMPYDKFLYKYGSIIRKSVACLKDNRFAVFVVGDLRDEDGFYRGFNSATKNCFIRAGAKLYNECKLLQPLGTAMLRANRVFGTNKKLVKVHEDVLIFYKGDPKKIREVFNEAEL